MQAPSLLISASWQDQNYRSTAGWQVLKMLTTGQVWRYLPILFFAVCGFFDIIRFSELWVAVFCYPVLIFGVVVEIFPEM